LDLWPHSHRYIESGNLVCALLLTSQFEVEIIARAILQMNGILIFFVHLLAKASGLAPWFPSHLQRDIYNSLLHLEQPATSGKENKTQAVPETVLKAALLRRATEDISRVMMIRDQKQALATLLQRGSVGDDLWQRFSRAEKEMEEEVRDVVSEVLSPCYLTVLYDHYCHREHILIWSP
jgi:hypothetical protein